MGFFTEDFMTARRNAVKTLIAKVQYEEGGTWHDATIAGSSVENNSVVIRATIPPTATVSTITGIRFLDSNNIVIGMQEANMPTSTARSKLIVFTCPIQEV